MNELQTGATRAFSLLRRLVKDGKQSAEETHEFIELIEAMASANLVRQLGAKIDAQNEKIDTINSKYTVLIWTIGFASLIISASIIFGG